MKKFTIILIALVMVSSASAQTIQPCSTCLPEGIIFLTQADIDNFQTNYPNCTEIEGYVRIGDYGSNNITNLNGLSALTSIGGYLHINYNNALTSLTGLQGLTTIGGSLKIIVNHLLTSLTGLYNLTAIGGDLYISDNVALTSLMGLDNINEGTINDLYINNNSSLSTCEAEWLCDYLASPNGSINIYGNATGCNNPSEVADACGITLQCLPFGNYYFLSQDEIDNFQSEYPNCTEIEGDVIIEGSSIINLYGLSMLESIGGDLRIRYNAALTSMTGLQGLTAIGGGIEILYLVSLTSLTGLDNLTYIGDYLYVSYNNILPSLTGLQGLTTIGGSLEIILNPLLTSMTGLDNLTAIGSDLGIHSNDALTSLTGLDNLTSIGDGLYISYNNILTSLTGLINLNSTVDTLWIGDNSSLDSLNGLDHIDPGSISRLTIRNNPLLTKCEVTSICDYLVAPNGTIEIQDNATGCNSVEEVEAACSLGFNEKAQATRQIVIYPTPSSTTITLSTPTTPDRNTFMTIFNINGQVILSHQITEQQTVVDVSRLSQGIYFLKVTDDRGVQVGKFVKQ